MGRRIAAIVSLGLVAATLEPVVRAPADDGFPLSTFPMFATPRATEVAISYAQGVTRDGRLRTLSPEQLGTGEVMQAFTLIQRAADGGAGELRALCAAIAARVAGDAGGDADLADVVAIRIVTGTHNAVDYLARGAVGHEDTRARCEIPR
jgi:hypothetical protein